MCPHAPAAKCSSVAVRDRAAHLLTHHRATLLELHEGAARLEDGLLHGSDGHLEGGAYLHVGETIQLAHHERGTLTVGQLLEIGDQQRQTLPLAGAILRRASALLASILELPLGPTPANQ
jgi:hypothetical protein